MKIPKTAFVYLALISTMIFWSITYVWAKQVLNTGIEPITLIFFRLTAAVAIMFPLLIIKKAFKQIRKSDIGLLMLLAMFEPFFYYLGEANGINLVSPNIASIIIATIPVFLLIFARILFKEKLSTLNYVGMTISFIGVLIIVFDKTGKISSSPTGIMYLFFAVFSAVGYTLLSKKLLDRYDPIVLVGLKNTIGWLYFIPVYFIFGHSGLETEIFSNKIILTIIGLGLFGNFLAYYFFNISIKNIGASKSSIFSNLIPVFTILFSIILLNDILPTYKFIGIMLALFGVYVSQIQKIKFKKYF